MVRSGEVVRHRVEPGQRYILGYTTLRNDPRGRSKDFQLDPRGPRIVVLPATAEQLEQPDAQTRIFVLAELALRPGLFRRQWSETDGRRQ